MPTLGDILLKQKGIDGIFRDTPMPISIIKDDRKEFFHIFVSILTNQSDTPIGLKLELQITEIPTTYSMDLFLSESQIDSLEEDFLLLEKVIISGVRRIVRKYKLGEVCQL